MPRIAVRSRRLNVTAAAFLVVLLLIGAARSRLSLASPSGDGADVNNVSLQAIGLPPGNQAVCGDPQWFTLRNVLHNNGPDTPVDVGVANAVAVPAGLEILFRVSNANQTITINGAPLDCTAPGGPAILCSSDVVNGVAPVGTTVDVKGYKSPGTVLGVRESLSLSQSVQTSVDQTWGFTCRAGTDVPAQWNSTVEVLAPSFDTDPSNNSRSLNLVFDCIIGADTDLAIVHQSVSHAPAPWPPLALPTLFVGEVGSVRLQKQLLNELGWSPVTTDIVGGVSLAYAGMDPSRGDCVVTPNPATGQVVLVHGTPVSRDEDFNIVCGQGGLGFDDDVDSSIDEDVADGVDNDADTRIDEDSPFYLVTATITNTIEADDPCSPDFHPTDNIATSSVTLAVTHDPVGGFASLPEIAGESSTPAGTYAALAAGLAAGILAVAAGLWYARRRWVR